jgi:hypothetical protein
VLRMLRFWILDWGLNANGPNGFSPGEACQKGYLTNGEFVVSNRTAGYVASNLWLALPVMFSNDHKLISVGWMGQTSVSTMSPHTCPPCTRSVHPTGEGVFIWLRIPRASLRFALGYNEVAPTGLS